MNPHTLETALKKRIDTVLEPSEPKPSADQAAAYNAWFRAQVEQGIKEADDPNTQWISNEAVKAESAQRRADWLKLAMAQSGGR